MTNPPPKNKNKARQKLTKATNLALWRANKSTQYHEKLSCVGKTPELQERTAEISGVLTWDYSYPLSYHLELDGSSAKMGQAMKTGASFFPTDKAHSFWRNGKSCLWKWYLGGHWAEESQEY